MADDQHALTIERFIDAPPSRVWQAWSEPEHLARWWIPAPIECRVVTLDLRPGGGFVTEMREGDGDFEPHVRGSFLEVVPEQRLVFTTVLAAGWQPIETWLALTAIITFRPQGEGTLYAARVLHRNDAERRQHEEIGFEEGWGAAIAQLAAYVDTMR